MNYQEMVDILGDEAESLFSHVCTKLPKKNVHLTGPHHVKEVFENSDRPKQVIRNLKRLYQHGRLGGSGYLSIFPVDQGVEHTAGYSFAHNPLYFDPEQIVKLAMAAETSAVASTVGVLGLVSKQYAQRIPFIVKINHNELLSYPNTHEQTLFAQVEQAHQLGAIGIGATIYFGSAESKKQISEISQAFFEAHQLGMFTILWCYPRNEQFVKEDRNLETAADITGQANYLGVTIEADIIKQKLPTSAARSFELLDFAKYSNAQYDNLLGDHPIDLVRYQVMNCYAGKIGLINSGGPSEGENDLREAIRTAVINKRGGGSGLIMGRKIFNRPFDKGVALLQAVQDVYLSDEVTIA